MNRARRISQLRLRVSRGNNPRNIQLSAQELRNERIRQIIAITPYDLTALSDADLNNLEEEVNNFNNRDFAPISETIRSEKRIR